MSSSDDLSASLDEKCTITNGEIEKESSDKPAEVVPADFNLDAMRSYFESCITPEGRVSVDFYIKGYDELYKFLNLLGTVFGWVASDVHAKLEIIRTFRNDEKIGKHFETIESMTTYEIEENLIKTKAKDCSTGSRNLLRLHRALQYIIEFLATLPDLEMTDKLCGPSQEAYKKTLEQYHPWVVKKAALFAMNLLPTKQGLLLKISAESEEDQKKAKETLTLAVAGMRDVYNRTEEIYKEKDLLALP